MLTKEDLVRLAINDYFVACNNHDHASVMSTFSETCVMHFPAATFRYRGRDDLADHFTDFLGNFKIINFHDFVNVVDVDSQSIVSYFAIHLTDHDDVEIQMRNCNIFHCDDSGLFNEIIIYNTAPLDKGFQAGNS